MKITRVMLCCAAFAATAHAGEYVLENVRGEVTVREGVQESWKPAGVLEKLRPHDSMRTGEGASAVLRVTTDAEGGIKRIRVPQDVILDLSDVRSLTRDELILKLTMERVKAAPYEWKENDLQVPNATVVHGSDRGESRPDDPEELQMARLQMNGAKVLFDNGYFSTCALRGLSLFGRYPSLGQTFGDRLLVAQSLERSDLAGEALNEYITLSSLPDLTPQQQSLVQERIARIRETR